MKYIERLKSNKGVTLTELLIGMGMFALFLTAISLLFTNLTQSRDTIIERSELNSLLDNLSAPIIRDLSNATAPINFNTCSCVTPPCSEPLTCDPTDPDCEIVFGCACDCHIPVTCTCVNLNGINHIIIPQGGSVSADYSVDATQGVLVRNCHSVECPLTGLHFHPVLQKSYYKNKSIFFTLTPQPSASGISYTLTLIIYNDRDGAPSDRFDDEIIRREYAVRPLKLNQFIT